MSAVTCSYIPVSAVGGIVVDSGFVLPDVVGVGV